MWLSLFLSSSALKWIGTSPPVEFLGDISYSFYLIHLPILLAVTSVLNPRIGSPLLCIAICLACSLVVAYAIYSWIEIPGQNLGKLASRAWSKRIGESAAAHAGTK
jgi:peptidoglycan/LPS O-acetylase OafA/YrhL